MYLYSFNCFVTFVLNCLVMLLVDVETAGDCLKLQYLPYLCLTSYVHWLLMPGWNSAKELARTYLQFRQQM